MKKLSGGKTFAVVAVAGGALAASVAPVLADVSAQSPSTSAVRVETNAKWKTWGAVAEVQVSYSCQAGVQAYLNVQLTQAVLGGIASGNAYRDPLPCTGGFETVTINVTATDRAFRLGTAFAKAELRGYSSGSSAKDERNVTIGL
ncbi:hypothetical protein [Nocardia sp. NRRL S-836]|uniref:hypothetical protein n=1 Tax=Nocardia sp. NRRL S-836 TaxID=1519492 RepID=UPI0006AF3568|nr:hypothetical protein [Nocardia sp. NRRL S-836]KOV76946.1 hypothetical protein ADL03_42765 [Nocardia sp. NRRL S-836]